MGALQVKKLLSELIAIPSVNPAFLPVGDPRAGENNIAHFIAEIARSSGLEVEFQKVLPARSNVLVQCRPSGKIKQRILLAPHLDTVGGEGLNDTFFKPRERSGRLHGRGACDTKGSVAAMLHAVLQLSSQHHRPAHTEIIFAGLIDEECGQAGSRALYRAIPRADLAIIGEPTELKIVIAHKGTFWIRLETQGKSAHGSRPELGRNAVREMARVVEVLEGEYRAKLKSRHHRLLGSPTMNVGTIRGGSQPNIVPAHCEITADRRTLPGETESSIKQELRALFRKHRLRVFISNTQTAWCPALETSMRQPLVSQFQQALRQKSPVGVDYFCDAAVLSENGIPSVVFGPGNIAQAHTSDEWISIRSLEQGSARLLGFLQSLP